VNWLDLVLGRGADHRPVIGPRPTVIAPGPTATVAPSPRFTWDEKRWRRIDDQGQVHYLGPYRVRDQQQAVWREFEGRIVEASGGIKAYVADPPAEIKTHPKGPCFQLVRSPWFRVHWRRNPSTVDEALLYVERLLDECLNQRPRGLW
jgi:hypothetical protein